MESFAADDERRRPLSSVRDRPLTVDEYLAKVHAESRKPKFGPWNAANWSQTSKTADHNSSASGHKDYNSWGSKEPQKHKGHVSQNGSSDDFRRKHGSNTEPGMVTTGGWTRPSLDTWATPPDGFLSHPTNETNAAMKYLKEAARPSATPSTDKIDSRKPARHVKFNLLSRRHTTDGNH